MKRALAVVLLLGCGSVPLPFEGHWTGTLLRDFECISGGGSNADVAVDWTISRDGDALSISTTEPDCPTLTAALLPSDATEARMDPARCTSTTDDPDAGLVNVSNARTWTDGQLRLRQDGQEMLVDLWEHDEGMAGGNSYVCDGLSFGALALEVQ